MLKKSKLLLLLAFLSLSACSTMSVDESSTTPADTTPTPTQPDGNPAEDNTEDPEEVDPDKDKNTDGQVLLIGDVTKITPGNINPTTPLTFKTALGGKFEGNDNPPSKVSGKITVKLTSPSSALKNAMKWNISLGGGSESSSSLSNGRVAASSDAVYNDVKVPVNETPSISSGRYLQIVVDVSDVSPADFVALNETEFTITVSYE